MQWLVLVITLGVSGITHAGPTVLRCDDLAAADFAIDGLLDDWATPVLARVGTPPDGAIALRCAWDGTTLVMALDIADDRVIRVPGKGHEDHVGISIAAGGTPLALDVFPANAMGKSKVTTIPPAAKEREHNISVGDSLQPKGFSIEVRVAASKLKGFSPSTPSLALRVVFHDADQAAGGDDTDVALDAAIELGDRKDLLDDFLRTVKLKKSDVRLDALAELDPDRKGKERIVAGGTVIGVLTDQFAFVSLSVAKAADVREVKLLPLGPRGQQVVSAVIRQFGNGGSRDLLMLWTVWSGQLQPLAQIELRKEIGKTILESTFKIVPGPKPELVVEARPAIGFTSETWNEDPAGDADAIVVPWDPKRRGVGYTLSGAELKRRDLPAATRRH